MSRIHSETPDLAECRLQEFVGEVRSVQEKFWRLSDSYKDIAETFSRAAARLRTISASRD